DKSYLNSSKNLVMIWFLEESKVAGSPGDELYENYGKIQVGSDFGLVLGNLEAFNELRRESDVRLGIKK
ncbi:MAG: hypothetical protein IJH65_03125, partial [Methanobrevibacter sp.]|nr:hypothetical protein [Methanobrevibacter sp.]